MISIELINREASRQMETMPPIMRTITNTTLIELDKKIKKFSQYEWNLDPFLREEFENLQLQPIEKIDRFIVTDILPKVEKELTPILTRLIANPTTARQLTSGITDIISLLSFLSINNNINSNNKNRNSSSSSNSNHWNYWYNWYDTGRNSDGLNGNIGGDPMNDFNNYLLDSVEEVTVNLEKGS